MNSESESLLRRRENSRQKLSVICGRVKFLFIILSVVHMPIGVEVGSKDTPQCKRMNWVSPMSTETFKKKMRSNLEEREQSLLSGSG